MRLVDGGSNSARTAILNEKRDRTIQKRNTRSKELSQTFQCKSNDIMGNIVITTIPKRTRRVSRIKCHRYVVVTQKYRRSYTSFENNMERVIVAVRTDSAPRSDTVIPVLGANEEEADGFIESESHITACQKPVVGVHLLTIQKNPFTYSSSSAFIPVRSGVYSL